MIGAAAGVLAHPPAELREGHDHHPVGVAGLLQVGHQRLHVAGQLRHQVVVTTALVGVGIEPALPHVIQPGLQAPGDHRRDGGHVPPQPSAITTRRPETRHGATHAVGRRVGFHRRRREEVEIRVPALLLHVQTAVGLGHLLVVAGPPPAKAAWILERDAAILAPDQRLGGLAAQRDRDRRIGLLHRLDIARQPAIGRLRGLRVAGVPDIHRVEVRAVRVGIADALHDRHVPRVIQRLERLQPRVQPDRIVQLEHLVLADRRRATVPVVLLHPVRHDRAEHVVAARELQHDQDLLALALDPLDVARVVERVGGIVEPDRDDGARGDQAHTLLEELTAGGNLRGVHDRALLESGLGASKAGTRACW